MTSDTKELLDDFFRDQWRNLIAQLVSEFGIQYLEDIENATQTALLKAMDVWSVAKPPSNIRPWMYRVARNALLDELRRNSTRLKHESNVKDLLYHQEYEELTDDVFEDLPDKVLQMVFICCDPQLTVRDSIILTLRVVSGFGFKEIANALLMSFEATKRAFSRCRKTISKLGLEYGVPQSADYHQRLSRVLRIIYLIFNEGYLATTGNVLVRKELCREADRLMLILRESVLSSDARVWALSSLICFQSSRLESRQNEMGAVVLLSEQDRGKWSKPHINAGFAFLDRATTGDTVSEYHLEAAIAACHAQAASYQQTNWQRIIGYYDDLICINSSPTLTLNRYVAIMELGDTLQAYTGLKEMVETNQMPHSSLLPAALAECCRRLNRLSEQEQWVSMAVELSGNVVLQEYWNSHGVE